MGTTSQISGMRRLDPQSPFNGVTDLRKIIKCIGNLSTGWRYQGTVVTKKFPVSAVYSLVGEIYTTVKRAKRLRN